MANDLRLIGDQTRLNAERQIRGEVAHRLFDIFAKREHVAALAHRNRDSYRWLSTDAEKRLRRVGIAPLDLSQIDEPKQPIVDVEIDLLQVRFGGEPA